MTNEKSLSVTNVVEEVVVHGDLSKLTPKQRVEYYTATCNSLGLNPLTRPFDYITLSGRLTLYARKDAAEQLRRIQKVSVHKLEKETIGGVYVVTAYGALPDGRQDIGTGAVNIENLKGDALANALMKAETKAKRRMTLSICGLGWLDETEIETIQDAEPVLVDDEGEIKPAKLNGKAKDDQPPTEKAWDEWASMLSQAEELGINVPELPKKVTMGQLRSIYGEVRDQVNQAERGK